MKQLECNIKSLQNENYNLGLNISQASCCCAKDFNLPSSIYSLIPNKSTKNSYNVIFTCGGGDYEDRNIFEYFDDNYKVQRIYN